MQKVEYKSLNHATNLKNMRLNNQFYDITIEVDGKEYRAHKNILAANLHYFKEAFLNESYQEIKKDVITIEGLKAADVEAFINYAYTGKILMTDLNAPGLLEVANRLSEDGIKEACIEFLKKHLKDEQAYSVYKLADAIDCLSLKNVAKSRLLTNFGNFSQTNEYLELNFEILRDLLVGVSSNYGDTQQVFFEGIVRWIMHDAKGGKNSMNDLLNYIDFSQLKAKFLMECAGKIANFEDDNGLTRDVMSYFYNRMKSLQKEYQSKHLEQILIVYYESIFQSYSFAEKKWSPKQKISNDNADFLWSPGAFLDYKLYYVIKNIREAHLQMFDPSTKQSTTLLSSSPILWESAACACDKFVYFCGGLENIHRFVSDQVLRYDPQTNTFENLPSMTTKRFHATATFYQGSVYVLGGHDHQAIDSVEKYNPGTNEWTSLSPMSLARRCLAVAVLGEKLYACGGLTDGSRTINSVEVYDPSKNSWQLVASMNKPRRDFLVIAHEGKLLAIGGDKVKTVEVYDPSQDQWQMDHQMSTGLQMKYVSGGLVPSRPVANVD